VKFKLFDYNLWRKGWKLEFVWVKQYEWGFKALFRLEGKWDDEFDWIRRNVCVFFKKFEGEIEYI